jgi:hypothetical protein
MATDESWLARPHRQHTAAPHVPRRGAPGRFVLIHPLYCPIPSHSQIATRSTRNRPARLHSNSLPSPKPASPQPPSFSTSTPPRVSSRLRPPKSHPLTPVPIHRDGLPPRRRRRRRRARVVSFPGRHRRPAPRRPPPRPPADVARSPRPPSIPWRSRRVPGPGRPGHRHPRYVYASLGYSPAAMLRFASRSDMEWSSGRSAADLDY